MAGLQIERLVARGVRIDAVDIERGRCMTLAGDSGSGKTLLLRAIADLDPNEGDMALDGQSRADMSGPAWRRRVTFVAAESAWWAPVVAAHATDWAPATLRRLGFEDDVLQWEVQRLSSGERQRLALARALAHRPDVLLLDEPTANLDAANTERVEHLIDEWRAAGGCACWVSHDSGQRARVGDARFILHAGRLQREADG